MTKYKNNMGISENLPLYKKRDDVMSVFVLFEFIIIPLYFILYLHSYPLLNI